MNNVATLSISTKAAPIAWVQSLFARMTACYGNKFLDMWRGADMELVKAMWAEEMGKLTNEELKLGYAGLMTRDWPPSLPEYVKMCRPPVDSLKAYYEALNGLQARESGEVGGWSHPAIFWAAIAVGAFDFKNQTYSQIKARWERALHEQMELGAWADIPNPMLQIAAPGKGDLSREKAAEMLNQLGAGDALKPKRDHKYWAKRIIADEKRKPGTWPSYSVKCANEALAA